MKRLRRWIFAAPVTMPVAALLGLAVWHGPSAVRAVSDPAAHERSTAATSEVTFNRDVAPIFFAQCVTCHRPGQVAPFSLLTYVDARKHAHEIEEVTRDRVMPPWKAKIGYGDFANVRQLSDRQIETIGAWINAGRPEGNPADLPQAPKFSSGWLLGQPDLVVKMPEPFTLPADASRDVYRVFVIPLHLDQDQYVSAVEFRPSNPRIVHHTLFYLDTSGAAGTLEAANTDHQPGYARVGGPGFAPAGGLGGWAPGAVPHFLPDGVGRRVPKGSELILHTHFHPTGKPEIEQSTVALYFLKSPPKKLLVTFPKATHRIDIPAGDSDYRLSDSFTVPADARLTGIIPHAHLLCKEIKVSATLPDGTEKPLIWIPKWDWDWQEQYQYVHPLEIPRGTTVHLRYRYDNSADNPKNPSNPPREVRWGEQTRDEMALVFFQLEIDAGSRNSMIGQALRDRFRRKLSQEAPTTQPSRPQ